MPANLKIVGVIATILLLCALIVLAGSQGGLWISGLPLFALCASVGFILHWLMFIPAYLFQTERYFDLTGSVSFLATVGLAVYLHPTPDLADMLIALLVSVWALRLGSFLFLRILRAGRDRRFDDIKPKFWRFLLTWTLAGAWVFLTLATALAAMTGVGARGIDIFMWAGLLVWLAGFTIEVVADWQKSRFRAHNSGFITTGLWSWSRHPNYFGEIVLWIGIALVALPELRGWQWVTLISPVFVIVLLTRVSGIPMLERSARERWGENGDYQRYVESTSVLIPLPPRR